MRSFVRKLLTEVKKVEFVRWAYFGLLGSYRRQWDAWARDPERAMRAIAPGTSAETFGPSGEEVVARLRPYVGATDRVLDVGCGMGRIMRPLAPSCREIHGVDVSPRMVRLAREFLADVPNASVHLTSGKDLAIVGAGSFQVAFVLYVLQHLEREHAVRYLAEMWRVLVPGGTIICEVPNLLFPRNLTTYVRTSQSAQHFSVARTRFYTPDELTFVLRELGFAIVEANVDSEIFVAARKEGRKAPAY